MMRPKTAARVCAVATVVLIILQQTGLTLYLYERSYEREFAYGPPDEDVRRAVSQLRAELKPHMEPLYQQQQQVDHALRIDSVHKCKDGLGRSFEQIRLLVVVKSALDHFANRRTIRNTWGWEDRFSDVVIRRVFLIGAPRPFDDADLQSKIDAEQGKHMDLVQGEFVDNYFNNTMKTLLGLGWVKRFCPTAEYALFVDDDYYVSIKNVLRFIRHPSSYPAYLKRVLLSIRGIANDGNVSKRPLEIRSIDDDDDEDEIFESNQNGRGDMYVGYRFFSKPHRWRLSKFFVSLEEYPFDRFPPYITAGAYIMSQATVIALHYASLYVMPFRFDDVFLGILARKAGIRTTHNDNFYFYRPPYVSSEAFAHLIATHGFGDLEELESVWNDQRSIGNA